MNADAKSYIEEIVDPTIADFRDHPASRRHAFLACVVTFHCIDYIMHPKKSKNLRRLFRKENLDFATVDRVAHAVKHVRSDGDSKSSEIQTRSLHVTSIFERPPCVTNSTRWFGRRCVLKTCSLGYHSAVSNNLR
jgi:hypothetical protein